MRALQEFHAFVERIVVLATCNNEHECQRWRRDALTGTGPKVSKSNERNEPDRVTAENRSGEKESRNVR